MDYTLDFPFSSLVYLSSSFISIFQKDETHNLSNLNTYIPTLLTDSTSTTLSSWRRRTFVSTYTAHTRGENLPKITRLSWSNVMDLDLLVSHDVTIRSNDHCLELHPFMVAPFLTCLLFLILLQNTNRKKVGVDFLATGMLSVLSQAWRNHVMTRHIPQMTVFWFQQGP